MEFLFYFVAAAVGLIIGFLVCKVWASRRTVSKEAYEKVESELSSVKIDLASRLTDSTHDLPLDLEEFVDSLISDEGHNRLRLMGWTESSITALYEIFMEWIAWTGLYQNPPNRKNH